jgi:hypothetical protein
VFWDKVDHHFDALVGLLLRGELLDDIVVRASVLVQELVLEHT